MPLHPSGVFSISPFDQRGAGDGLHSDASITPGSRDNLNPSLTLASLQTAVVAHRTEELENEDSHSHYGQAHDEHHHPNCWTVRLFTGKKKS